MEGRILALPGEPTESRKCLKWNFPPQNPQPRSASLSQPGFPDLGPVGISCLISLCTLSPSPSSAPLLPLGWRGPEPVWPVLGGWWCWCWERVGPGPHIWAGRCCWPGGKEEAAKAPACVSNSFLIHFPSEVVLRKCAI